MVGRKVTLRRLKAYLRDAGDVIEPDSVRTTEFCQGRQVRWGIAWQVAPPRAESPESVPNKVTVFSDSEGEDS